MYRISSLEIVCPSLVPRAGSECTALLWLVAAAGLLGGLCTKGGSSLLLPTSSRKDWRLLAVGGGWPEVLLESTACGGEEESLILEVFPGWAKLALSFTGLWDLVIGYLLPAASDNGRPLPLLVTPSLRCPVSGRIRYCHHHFSALILSGHEVCYTLYHHTPPPSLSQALCDSNPDKHYNPSSSSGRVVPHPLSPPLFQSDHPFVGMLCSLSHIVHGMWIMLGFYRDKDSLRVLWTVHPDISI